MRLYLADLGHNLVTATSDTYPLGVGNLATYAQAHAKSPTPIEVAIFRDPQEFKAAVDTAPPDMVGFSSYSWNHHLALSFADYVKAVNPNSLTLMGGPNFPLTEEEQDSWIRTMPQIDMHVRGPTYEGERAFLSTLQRFIDVGARREGMWEEAVDGALYVHPETGEILRGAEPPRIRDLDEIPSPYLAGLMDKFFDTGLFALMQLARGCPFTCAFCNSAVKSNSKVFRHSFERTKADLDYIVARINHASPLCFADDNFGMYVQDEEVADYLGHLMERYDWPKYIRTTTGKNRGDRIIKVMRKAKGRLPMTSSVQSLNPEVLKNIKRDNISLDTYAEVQQELHSKGMQSYGELILCMPGETRESFMDAVDQLIETGVSRVAAHQLMLLHGAPLANPDSREKFGFKTLHRVVARCLGKYTGPTVVETEEMVVQSENFSFQDYLDTRVFHLLLTIFYYEDNFEEAFRLARSRGIRPFLIVKHMQDILDQAPKPFRDAVAGYLEENQQELFETRADCVAWAQENYDDLISGELGGNLLSKYSMIGRFIVLDEALDFLKRAISDLLDKDDHEAHEMLDTIINYYSAVMLHVPFSETLEHEPVWSSSFDVEAWRNSGYQGVLQDYQFDAPREFQTQVDQRVKTTLLSRIETFGEHASGLGRFTRTMFANDFRRNFVSGESQHAAE
ncbi:MULTISPECIES: B12-binding domain-containing radical SAM protein [unclassified Ruegeria]|uniref:B12-binding domain-containing radical SAM protein n=1 Tax=unclassified Ruegeria TaxID=2625375 RepID=UPI001490EC26|nr:MULTISPECIES: radical SAM protein [unclassified Ruegeria]NOC85793.1 radical SAM protein [Ruegeria sp. HKCCD6428]NOC94190.1 radical SAM protein [Ruegeria sp. HKCCD6604]